MMRKYMSKRQRPCDFCRSRKTACRIDQSPPCRSCTLNNRECTFLQEAPPRKRSEALDSPSSPSVEANQDAQSPIQHTGLPVRSPGGLFTQQLPNENHAVGQSGYDGSINFLSGLDIDLDLPDFQFIQASSPSTSQQTQCPTWYDQSTDTHRCTQTLDYTDGARPQVLGLSGDMDPYLLQRYNTNDHGIFHFKHLDIHSVQSEPQPVHFLTSNPALYAKSREDAGHTDVSHDQLRVALEEKVPAHTGARLISLFHKFIAPQFPIFSAQAMPNPGSAPVHLLAAIYVVSFPFSVYDEQLCIDLAYDTPAYADLSLLINSSLWPDLHSPDLNAVQTLVLLVIRPLSNPLVSETPYKWSLMGLLISTAVNLGLHLDAGQWKAPMWQVALRRRLSFLIFVIDKWMAASLGRPRQLHGENWLVTTVKFSDRVGTNMDDVSWDDLMYSSSLSVVLDSVLANFL